MFQKTPQQIVVAAPLTAAMMTPPEFALITHGSPEKAGLVCRCVCGGVFDRLREP
jgi:hypothetical protein